MRASHALHLGFWPDESTQHGEELCCVLNGGYGIVCGGEEPFLSDNNPESPRCTARKLEHGAQVLPQE